MVKVNAMELYKSGINRINAPQNPFKAQNMKKDETPQITVKHNTAVIKTNRFYYAAAVAGIILITIAAIGFIRSRDIEISQHANSKASHESSDNSLIGSFTSATTSQSPITTTQSAISSTSSLISTSSRPVKQHNYANIDEAVKAYRSCEDEIQLTLKEFKAVRSKESFNAQDLQKYQNKLNELTKAQSDITDNILKDKLYTSDIVILDARPVENTDKPTAKIVIMNVSEQPITMLGNGTLTDLQTGEQVGRFELISQSVVPNAGARSTIYFDASNIPSDITQKITSERKKYSITFNGSKLQESSNGYVNVPIKISTVSWFESKVWAMSYLDEDGLYKRNEFEKINVIGQ